MNTQRLTSLGTVALVLAGVGCGSSGDGGKTGSGGGGATGTGGTSGTGGATGTGGANQTSDYSFTVTPTALSLPPGGMQDVVVNIDRAERVGLHRPDHVTLEIPNSITGSGVTQTIAPNPATAASTTLTVNVGTTGIVAGKYTLDVVGTGTGPPIPTPFRFRSP